MVKMTLIQGDCLKVLPMLPSESVDLILTDPPYNIGKDFENDNLLNKDFLDWCEKWIIELNRVLKVGGALYLTLGWQCVAEIKTLFNEVKCLRLKNWIIWYRQDGWKTDKGFCHSHEHILYYIKDNVPLFDLKGFGEHIKKRRLEAGYKTVSDLMEAMGIYTKIKRANGTEDYRSGNGFFESGKKKPTLRELTLLHQLLGLDKKYSIFLEPIHGISMFNIKFNRVDVWDDVWLTPKSEKHRDGHPTQKPAELFKRIITASSNQGDLILDCFLGSGTSMKAALELHRNCIGIEINPAYIKICKDRLNWGSTLDNSVEWEFIDGKAQYEDVIIARRTHE